MNQSRYADPEADSLGYPHREVPPCRRGTPSQSSCRIACAAPGCVYLTHGQCPWPQWSALTDDERKRYNRQWPHDGSESGQRLLAKLPRKGEKR